MKAGILAAMLRLPSQRREEKQALASALSELAFVGLADQAGQPAGSLSYGKQRLLEIARALATRPRLLILDEPAGGMNDQETAELVDLIRKIRDRGVTVLLIEHDMNLVMRVCEQLIVLEYGTKIAEGLPEDIRKNPRVIAAYLGADEDDPAGVEGESP
jgi:branched-chain amino acid transport system ATP-binding protein